MQLDIYKIGKEDKRQIWEVFRKYHYLNTELANGAMQYVGVIGDEVVCHTGIIQTPMKKGQKRVHRLVVLPDYQGIGIGLNFINAVAEDVIRQGYTLDLITTTPALRFALCKSPKWTLFRYGRSKNTYYEDYGQTLKKCGSDKRITYSFRYNG